MWLQNGSLNFNVSGLFKSYLYTTESKKWASTGWLHILPISLSLRSILFALSSSFPFLSLSLSLSLSLCLCVCVCVCERERERWVRCDQTQLLCMKKKMERLQQNIIRSLTLVLSLFLNPEVMMNTFHYMYSFSSLFYFLFFSKWKVFLPLLSSCLYVWNDMSSSLLHKAKKEERKW